MQFASNKKTISEKLYFDTSLITTHRASKGTQPFIAFRATSVKWISDIEVEVDGGYYEAGLSASGNTYIVTKQKGKWVVSSDRMNWIAYRPRPFRFLPS